MIHDDNGNVGGCGGKDSGWAGLGWAGEDWADTGTSAITVNLLFYELFLNWDVQQIKSHWTF